MHDFPTPEMIEVSTCIADYYVLKKIIVGAHIFELKLKLKYY